jgi:hypothetical protein
MAAYRPLCVALIALLLRAAPAHADAEPPPPRPVPDYDGRGDEPTTAGEVLLWVPRVLLSPLYLVSEYVVRRPIGWLITTVEREKIAGALLSIFQFGPNDEIAIVPTALIDLGFEPSVGVYARWNDFLTDDNKLRLHFATWGPEWLRLTLADRVEWRDGKTRLQLRGEATRRPDGLFFGIGQDSLEDNESRYAYRMLEGVLSFDTEAYRASSFHAFARVRDMRFGAEDTCCDEPSLAERLRGGSLRTRSGDLASAPPGFGGYTIYAHGAQLILDSRQERPAAGSGVQLGLDAEYAFDIHDPVPRQWARVGAAPSVFIDLTERNRVLHLGVIALLAVPLEGDVPFTELPDLGGTGPLKGFVQGWVIGESAAAASLEYDWPIWVWLDGTIHAALGNAFGPDFEGFDVEAGRFSTGIGIRTVDERDHAFDLLLAFGTEPLRDGGGLDSVRFVFGGTRVF